MGSSIKEFHESPPENAAPALYGSQLRRRLKLSQELCQYAPRLTITDQNTLKRHPALRRRFRNQAAT